MCVHVGHDEFCLSSCPGDSRGGNPPSGAYAEPLGKSPPKAFLSYSRAPREPPGRSVGLYEASQSLGA